MISRNVLLGLLVGLLVTLKIETTLAQEKPEAEILRVPEVVVSATRLPDLLLDLKRVPAQVRVTTGEEIESSGAKTVPEVIQYQPGITQYQSVGNAIESSLDMRGFIGGTAAPTA